MSGFRGVMNNGWHPKGKDGGKESWRGDFKGINQVAGWMGKGKDSSKDDRAEHVSRPLSSLKDPASFGPPPKRGESRTYSSTTTQSGLAPAPGGLGSALSPEAIVQEPQQTEEDSGPPPPPLPYRTNRTGIDPTRLPPPPVRRTESPVQPSPTSTLQSRPQPALPPRLPSRNTPPPPPYSEADHSIQMNQGSISRLEQAGVSVPALGIGRRDSDQSGVARGGMNNQVNELQARFAKTPTPGLQPLQSPYSPVGRPTSQQGIDNTPTSPASSRPAPLTPSSTNNFRQRSNEHIETGKQKLTEFNKKHRITERIGSYFEPQPALKASQGAPTPPPLPPPHPNLSRQSSNIDMESLNKRKAPPPPPPAKKANLKSTPVNGAGAAESPSPPPLPLGTKPR